MKFNDIKIIALILLCSCSEQHDLIRLNGEAQGSTYHITYIDPKGRHLDHEIDSIFNTIDASLSTYLSSSLLSRFNKCEAVSLIDEHIKKVYLKSSAIFEQSEGAFDPTVMPLVKYWGFAGNNINPPDTVSKKTVDSILKYVGFKHVRMACRSGEQIKSFVDNDQPQCDGQYVLIKDNPNVAIDFNAIAQGYTVDVISEFIMRKNIKNFLVEVGGEVRAQGKNKKNIPWRIGIDKPLEQQDGDRPLQAILNLDYGAVATSGNYRKYYVKDGIKYAHTLDPFTGYPVQHSLLSATVFSKDCITADGWATAFMVIGMEKSKSVLKTHSELQAFLVYSTKEGLIRTWSSSGIKKMLESVADKEE